MRATRRTGRPFAGSTRASHGMNAERRQASCSSLFAVIAGSAPGFDRACFRAISIEPATPPVASYCSSVIFPATPNSS